MCRLEPGQQLQNLCLKLRNHQYPLAERPRPLFLIGEPNGEHEPLASHLLSLQPVYEKVCRNEPFRHKISFFIDSDDKRIGLYLSLSDDPSKDVPISGFPRCLYSSATGCKAHYPKPVSLR